MLEVCCLPAYTALRGTMPLADSGIIDGLVKLRPFLFHENADESLSAVV